MSRQFLQVHKIIIATIAGISLASMLAIEPSLANPNQPFKSLESDRNTNPLSNSSGDFNMLEMIHQANFGNIQWNADEQNQQLDLAAQAFRAEQQKRLQIQTQQQNPGTPANTSNLNQNLLPLLVPSAGK
ncbi:MAG: hypothetical protein ACKO3K_16625 [Cuspidothrix sp.]